MPGRGESLSVRAGRETLSVSRPQAGSHFPLSLRGRSWDYRSAVQMRKLSSERVCLPGQSYLTGSPRDRWLHRYSQLQALDGRGVGWGRAGEAQTKQSWGLGGWGFGAGTPKSQP